MKLTKEDYQIAIGHLQLAMTQLEPDGRICAICHDNGHQAFECHHNPLVNNIALESALDDIIAKAKEAKEAKYQLPIDLSDSIFILGRKATSLHGRIPF